MDPTSENIIEDSTERLFAETFPREALSRASQGQWLASQWAAIEEAGLPMALVDEEFGGFGMRPEEALAIVRLAGKFAVPLPLSETMLANLLLGRCRRAPMQGAYAMSVTRQQAPLTLTKANPTWRVQGSVFSVCWPHSITGLVAVASTVTGERYLVRIFQSGFVVRNIVGGIHQHPLANVDVAAEVSDEDCAPLPDGLDLEAIARLGAALRVVAMAGSLRRILEMTVAYTSGRLQFGRPLSKFQVIQHDLAKIATQTAVATACADMIAEAFPDRVDPALAAMTKARTGEAAGIVAGLAHQLHGAIGTTQEFDLHFFTNQLWQWRDEFGNETYWYETLTREALRHEGGLWPFITELGV